MLKVSTKSQASVEFLTTYAWAFTGILVAVGAIYYFGLFDFSKFLPQECNFPSSQLECSAFSLSVDKVKVRLVNNLGEKINANSFSITNNAVTPLSCTVPAPIPSWEAGIEKDLEFASCKDGGFVANARVEAKITVNYCAPATPGCITNDPNAQHAISGKVNGMANP